MIAKRNANAKSSKQLKRGSNANKAIASLEAMKASFTAIVSSYTTKIQFGKVKKSYVKTLQPPKVFAAYNKVKRDVTQKRCPHIDPDSLVYFNHSLKQSFFADKVINIDLKSAYATILKKDGYISTDTFNYISHLDKMSRLASVGMLASKKTTYRFKKGKIVDSEEWVSPNAGYFYHCVKKTSNIMRELQHILGEEYLFTWADGIYFLPNPKKENQARAYLKKIGFPFSVALLSNFEVIKDDLKFKVTFNKGSDSKIFHLPINDPFKNSFIKAIHSLNKKKYATSKVKISA